MPTFDFSGYPDTGAEPRRAEQLRIASNIDFDDIRVEHAGAPIGSHGFRTGTWTVYYKGETYRVYASVPHSANTADQERIVKTDAALLIAGKQSGYM